MTDNHTWALVLAAGDGSRLRSLTTAADGTSVPKQFCSLRGGPSLLEETSMRARALVPAERIITIVAAHHRQWWDTPQHSPPNTIVQPRNRGTGIGILLSLLHILERDPLARIVFLPSDHYVQREGILMRALQDAGAHLASDQEKLLVLGLQPEKVDADLGYILPGTRRSDGKFDVSIFVEKPSPAVARELISRGALWNTFIMAAGGHKLLRIFQQRCEAIVAQLRAAVQKCVHLAAGDGLIEQIYRRLPVVDFSRDILEGQEAYLRVLQVPHCGWSDLGTPERVAEALRRCSSNESVAHPLDDTANTGTYVNLAMQQLLAQSRDIGAQAIA